MKKQLSLDTIMYILTIMVLLFAVFASLIALEVIHVGEGGMTI